MKQLCRAVVSSVSLIVVLMHGIVYLTMLYLRYQCVPLKQTEEG